MDDDLPLTAGDTTDGIPPEADDAAGDAEATGSLRDELFDAIAATDAEAPAGDDTNATPTPDATNEPANAGATPAEATTTGGADADVVPAPDASAPPTHWPAEVRAAFDGMTDDAAKGIVLDLAKRQEAAHTKRSEELAVQRREIEPWQPMISKLEPYQQSLALQGIDAPAFMGSLFAAHESLVASPASAIASIAQRYNADPSEVIRAIAQQSGLDLSELAFASAETPGTTPDPAMRDVNDRLRAIEGAVTQANQSTVTAAQAQGATMLTAFISTLNEQGQPLRPYYAEVEDHLLGLAKVKEAQGVQVTEAVLGELYDQAVWANPATRAKALQDRDRTQTTQRREMADKAKSSTGVITTPGGGGGGAQPATLHDELQQRIEAGSA